MARRGFVGWTPSVEPEPIERLEPPAIEELEEDVAYVRRMILSALAIPEEFLRERDHVVAPRSGR